MRFDAAFAFAALLAARRQPQPGGEVLLARPARSGRCPLRPSIAAPGGRPGPADAVTSRPPQIRASNSCRCSICGAFLPGALAGASLGRRPPGPPAGGSGPASSCSTAPSPGHSRRSFAGRTPTPPAPAAAQRDARPSSCPAATRSPLPPSSSGSARRTRPAAAPGRARPARIARTTFSRSRRSRSLITSWNLTFIRSRACCIFCTWLAAPMMWSARSRW